MGVGLVRSFGEGTGEPVQYSCLENSTDGGAWWAAVHGVVKSQTRLSDFTLTFHFHALEKEMATHSSVLAWRIPWREKPGGLLSMGSHRVGHDWSKLAAGNPLNQSRDQSGGKFPPFQLNLIYSFFLKYFSSIGFFGWACPTNSGSFIIKLNHQTWKWKRRVKKLA